jgi:hypothetical protein
VDVVLSGFRCYGKEGPDHAVGNQNQGSEDILPISAIQVEGGSKKNISI